MSQSAAHDEFTCIVQNPGIGEEEQPRFRKVFSADQVGSVPASWAEAPAELNLPEGIKFSVEVREYEPMVVATTPYLEADGAPPSWASWPGSWWQPPQRRMQTAAFFRLAGYIGVFSQIPGIGRFLPPKNNTSAASAETVPIAMTAPVLMTPTPSPIAMTAPVLMTPSAAEESDAASTKDLSQMSFVLPKSLFKSAADAPAPTDSNVTLRDIPGRFQAVLQVHGPKAQVPEQLGDEYKKVLASKLAELPEFHTHFKSKELYEVLGYAAPMAKFQTREYHIELERTAAGRL